MSSLPRSLVGEQHSAMSKNALKKLKRDQKKADKAAKTEQRKADEAKHKADQKDEVSEGLYGKLPVIQSATREHKVYANVTDLNAELENQTVLLRVRVQTIRPAGGKMCFLTLRSRAASVQGIITVGDKVSKQMVQFCTKITPESVIDVKGKISCAQVKACTQNDVEVQIQEIFVVSAAKPRLPLQLEDAARSDADAKKDGLSVVGQDTRLDNRWLDLRAIPNQSIFKIQAAVCRFFREFLLSQGFQEIHTPKMIATASEGGANVFTVSYFDDNVYLAQSPQLYKQMAINCDFDRVFEIGPVFRAENSFTNRHLTEFTGLDMEMAFKEHYHEVLDMLDQMFVHIFKRLQAEYATDIANVRKQFDREPFEFLEPSLRLEWPDAIAMLREAGEEIGDLEDLSTPMEKRLGALVKAKYHTDFYILDKFPLHIRPFYTMPDPNNPEYSNSYDIMMRGEEIMSGAQRIHDVELLKAKAAEHEVDLDKIKPYIDSFEYGSFPHGGGGVGMERVVMLFLGLPNIRKTSMFPRDPRRCAP